LDARAPARLRQGATSLAAIGGSRVIIANRRSRFRGMTRRERGGCRAGSSCRTGGGRRTGGGCRAGSRRPGGGEIGGSRMHEGIDAQIGHGEGDHNWSDESARADQPPQSCALGFVQSFQRRVQVGIIFFHGGRFRYANDRPRSPNDERALKTSMCRSKKRPPRQP
jgi:hypothetical protein